MSNTIQKCTLRISNKMDILFHTRRKWNLACLTHGWRGSKINILNCLQFGYSDMTRWSVFKLILQLMFWTWRIVSGGLDSTVCQGRLQCAFFWEKDFWKLRGEERANIQGCNLSCYMLMKCLFRWIKEVVGAKKWLLTVYASTERPTWGLFPQPADCSELVEW